MHVNNLGYKIFIESNIYRIIIKRNEKIDKRKQAEELAKLTFQLEKMCSVKESLFASGFDLTATQYRCLRYVYDQPNQSMKKLAENMNLTPGRITHILTSLEKKNLLTREMGKKDRRNIRVNLTEEAIPFVKKMNNEYVSLHEQIIENMKAGKSQVILTSLNEMFDAMKGWTETENET